MFRMPPNLRARRQCRGSRLRALALLGFAAAAFAAPPRLLLTPQRLHRLQLERDRGDARWQAFEQRIQTDPESSERGFELALYYAITGNEQKGREALAWAARHVCDIRQAALVLNWTGTLASEAEKKSITSASCPASAGKFTQMRDALFIAEVRGDDPPQPPNPLELNSVPEGAELYALAEYISVYRQVEGEDLRRPDRTTFAKLPSLVLLALPPGELSHPSWQQHAAALALVALDPNLQASQFLQSWAMEDRFTSREGPGVAYEVLWADPYLPGVGYENMQPWIYDSGMQQLYARSSWQDDACWIHIAPNVQEQRNCPAGWSSGPVQFGDLSLQPFPSRCVKLPASPGPVAVIVHTPRARAPVKLYTAKDQQTATSDAAGLWAVPKDASPERICLER